MEIDLNELLYTALRASFVYFFLLLIVRLLGKREIGNTSAFDLIVALILGEVVDEMIYGDVTMLQGVIAITVVAVWHGTSSIRGQVSRVRSSIRSQGLPLQYWLGTVRFSINIWRKRESINRSCFPSCG